MELRANMPDGSWEIIYIDPFDQGETSVVFRAVFTSSGDTLFFELPTPFQTGLDFFMDLAQGALDAWAKVRIDDFTDAAFAEIVEGL